MMVSSSYSVHTPKLKTSNISHKTVSNLFLYSYPHKKWLRRGRHSVGIERVLSSLAFVPFVYRGVRLDLGGIKKKNQITIFRIKTAAASIGFQVVSVASPLAPTNFSPLDRALWVCAAQVLRYRQIHAAADLITAVSTDLTSGFSSARIIWPHHGYNPTSITDVVVSDMLYHRAFIVFGGR